ncbi:hypothetical protein C8Q80DRAFT_1267861 [Daedaleopsis nitida]|nr:hypothetical protein C8Q80DRAFT_1267861 [Daedaleopsis nitida]
MEILHQYLISHTIYKYLVADHGDMTALNQIDRSLVVQVFLEAVTALCVQSFFVFRIWRLSEKKLILVVPIASLIAANFGVATAYAVRGLRLKLFTELAELEALAFSMNGFAAAADVAIAATMCIILHSSKTEFQSSTLVINRLMLFSVRTGLLTSACACLSLVTNLTLGHSFVYICFFVLIGRLYANSLFSTLNARQRLRRQLHGSVSDLSTIALQDMPPGPVDA